MMEFHYDVIEKHHKDKRELIYSDTDSLVYLIKSPNRHKWMNENEDEFDLSNLTTKWKSDKNENVLGKFKNETGSKIISEFLSLSPKLYAYKYADTEVKRAKGVSLSVSDKAMDFDDYQRTLETGNIQTRKIYGIQSFNQQLFSTCTDKIVLTSFYDKFKLLDEINCEPFGYEPIDCPS